MGVYVYEPWRGDQPAGIDDLFRTCAFEIADIGDLAAAHGDVGVVTGRARAVDNNGVADEQVVVLGHRRNCLLKGNG